MCSSNYSQTTVCSVLSFCIPPDNELFCPTKENKDENGGVVC